tara:strand:- start:126 stop:323 length:198 start_codon:yes stop_codon:yes gene_type:complete
LKNKSTRGKIKSTSSDEEYSFGKRGNRKRKTSRHQAKKLLRDVKQGNIDDSDYQENMEDYDQWSD